MRFFSGIGSLLQQLDEAVFPSSLYCLCCGAMIDESRSYSLCDDCIRKFHWITGTTCDACGKALPERTVGGDVLSGQEAERPRLCYDCMSERPLFTKGFSCVTYGLHEREIMMDLKYAGRGYIARRCGDMMFDRIEVEIDDGVFSQDRSPIDMIVPVPIGPDRGAERGYNQSALMAAQLARRWREFVREARVEQREPARSPDHPSVRPPDHPSVRPPVIYQDLLYRTRKTRKLRSLSPAERALELQGAFKVRSRYIERIRGARILLVDDIHTTGATANACTKALLDAGASEVFFLSWASGGNRQPSSFIPLSHLRP